MLLFPLQVGFGTYKVGFIPASASAAAGGQQQAGGTEATARECVKLALGVGYRFLDCAQVRARTCMQVPGGTVPN